MKITIKFKIKYLIMRIFIASFLIFIAVLLP